MSNSIILSLSNINIQILDNNMKKKNKFVVLFNVFVKSCKIMK